MVYSLEFRICPELRIGSPFQWERPKKSWGSVSKENEGPFGIRQSNVCHTGIEVSPKKKCKWAISTGKMFHTISHQGNTNQTTMRYYFIPIRVVIIKKKKRKSEEVEKWKPLFIAGRNVKWSKCCGKQHSGFSKGST